MPTSWILESWIWSVFEYIQSGTRMKEQLAHALRDERGGLGHWYSTQSLRDEEHDQWRFDPSSRPAKKGHIMKELAPRTHHDPATSPLASQDSPEQD